MLNQLEWCKKFVLSDNFYHTGFFCTHIMLFCAKFWYFDNIFNFGRIFKILNSKVISQLYIQYISCLSLKWRKEYMLRALQVCKKGCSASLNYIVKARTTWSKLQLCNFDRVVLVQTQQHGCRLNIFHNIIFNRKSMGYNA